MSAHTPGPWKVQEGGKYVEAVTCTVARIYHLPDLMDDADAESQANARLIAAAPALLEALERIRGHVHPELREIADAAIAQATGD
jgi:hypothetical protein